MCFESVHVISLPFSSSFQASAMCVFSLEEMKKVFDGDFLYKEDLQSSWKRVKNPGHFSEVRISC